MIGWRVDPNLPLELLNGSGMVLELCFLTWMALYLWRETERRHISYRAWFGSLPPSMHLAVAMFVFDSGVWIRTTVIWVWRRFFGAADFSMLQLVLLGLGGAVIVIGSLCKIRAITKPDFGDGPWLWSLAFVAVFIGASLLFR